VAGFREPLPLAQADVKMALSAIAAASGQLGAPEA
jgi:hypothetical protein